MNSPLTWPGIILQTSILSAIVLFVGCTAEPPPPSAAAMSVTRTLGSQDTDGYKRALAPRELIFPQDHGSHPEFKNEWWYATGNLETADGRMFGFQFTLFRSALSPPGESGENRDSAWASNQAFLAHTALSDIDNGQFLHHERFSRGALELAGAQTDPLRFWLDDWNISEDESSDSHCPECLVTRLSVATDDYQLSMSLRSRDGPVLHGNRGLSAKSGTPGNASYYYSYTQLIAEGEITVGSEVHQVTGKAWFDHEWSTSALEENQDGWDWFSLQLDGGQDLMLFQLRDRIDPALNYLSGTLVESDGEIHSLGNGDFLIAAKSWWKSPTTDANYPSSWEISVPEHDLQLAVRSLLPDQEVNSSFRYWEGAVEVESTTSNASQTGRGYAELTGYGKPGTASK
jgi:predicted secreted hydrolase